MAQQESDMTRRGWLAAFGATALATVLPRAAEAQQFPPSYNNMRQGPVNNLYPGTRWYPDILPLYPSTIAEEGVVRSIRQNYYEASILTSIPGVVHYNVVSAKITFEPNGLYRMDIDGWQANPGRLPIPGLSELSADPPFRFSFKAQQLPNGTKKLTAQCSNFSQESLALTGKAYVDEFYRMVLEDIARQRSTQTPTSEIHTVHRADGSTVTGFYNYSNPALGLSENVGNFTVEARIDYNSHTHVNIEGIDALGRRIQVTDFDMFADTNIFENKIRITERPGSRTRAVDQNEAQSLKYLIALAQQATGGAQAEPNVPKALRRIVGHLPVYYYNCN